jgi:hypothetical protein
MDENTVSTDFLHILGETTKTIHFTSNKNMVGLLDKLFIPE